MTMTKTGFAGMALGFLLAVPAAAQLPSASTPALGMGDNFTAAARGYHAVAWNPALLGLSGNPRSSLALAPLRLVAGLDPITLKDLKDNEGIELSAATKARWLADVTAEGSEQGSGGGDVTYLAAQIGKFAVQFSSRARAVADLGPGAVRVLLYGNTDEQGNPQAIALAGSELNAAATSTAAASYALPLKLGTGGAAIGVTLKYTIGHLYLHGSDNNSQFTAQPAVNLSFPTVTTVTENAELNNGSGLGLDVGFALQRGNMTLSAAVQNVFNSFKWKTENLTFRPGSAIFNSTTKQSSFDETPYTSAPQALRTLVDNQKYKPTIAAGVALMPNSKLTLSADVRSRLSDEGIQEAPKLHAGAGLEYKLLSFLPVRAGAAIVTGGSQYGAGLGLILGPFNIGASLMRRDSDLGTDTVTMFTLISTGR